MIYRKTHLSAVSSALCGLVFLLFCSCSLFEGTVSVDTRSSLRVPRIDLGTAVAEGKIYAIGGFSDQTVAVVEVYNPQTDSWTQQTDMPTPRRLFAIAAIDDNIYATGGMNFTDGNNVTYIYTTEIYDPVADSWTIGADLPMATPVNSVLGNAFMGAVALQNKLYVVVYNSEEPGGSAMYVYDPPPADSWSTKSAPPSLNSWDSREFAAVVCGGEIYVFQGGGLARYDPSTDLWETLAEAFHRRYAGGFCVQGQRMYAIGGIDDGELVPSVEVYRPDIRLWANQGWLVDPRAYFSWVTLADSIYLVGGTYSTHRYSPEPLGVVERVTMK
jgi:kelch-like protein 17 (actinfilin)/kelch-like protein 20